MRALLVALLSFPAFSQQFEVLKANLPGLIARDSSGNWIVADGVNPNLSKLRVRKFSPDLTQTLFDRLIGGSGSDELIRLRLDTSGNIYVLGHTTSTDFPTTPGVIWPSSGADTSYFFVKLNSQGATVFSTYLQSGGLDIDGVQTPEGSWIIATESLDGYPVGAQGITLAGSGSLVVLKINQDATRLLGGVRFGSVPGLADSDKLSAVARDVMGNVYVAGFASTTDFPVTPNAFLRQFPNPNSSFFGGFIAKFNSDTLQLIAATLLGGQVGSGITSVATDRNGFVYVAGNVERAAGPGVFPTTPGAFQTGMTPGNFVTIPLNPGAPAASPTAVFVSKLTPDLSALAYSTLLSGSGFEWSTSIQVDDAGEAIVTGATYSLDFPATGAFRNLCGPADTGPNRTSSGFITTFDPQGRTLVSSAVFRSSFDPALANFVAGSHTVIAGVGSWLIQFDAASGNKPSVACAANGANFEQQPYVAPRQVIALIGANFPQNAGVLFDGIAAKVLYQSATQINAVVPKEVSGRLATNMELNAGGVRSNARPFDIRGPHPTMFLQIMQDGTFAGDGNPLAHVRLSDGSLNGPAHPAKAGDLVTIYTTGLNLALPLSVQINGAAAQLIGSAFVPGTNESVERLNIRIPSVCCSGIQGIRILNGQNSTEENAGSVFVQ